MATNFEPDIASLLTELSSIQTELLALLDEKRRLLIEKRADELGELETRERDLIGRLQTCHDRRGQLLAQAEEAELPCDSLRSLVATADQPNRGELRSQIDKVASDGRILQHKSLANWVFVQRWLIHLSQLLEIIATGGQLQPTYGKGTETNASGGALVDQAA
ncbi:MAG: hypothetical protein DWQ31_13150 [Planctomycetota bacterium]|nr:MAG: hypothetical protein DWQ31_13150 [Planctomycetota bacterium]REJ87082.1 MAG: hypothetical protein DWQ35_22030 [Planctomycetota bacterium]REK27000.1 MAG: hypothetical protein DWQ42_08045 [Planctomycetota bacterium]REK47273.1 MAG: hypothetical protein DWQ46_04565 [Planctomycetota bacterium]